MFGFLKKIFSGAVDAKPEVAPETLGSPTIAEAQHEALLSQTQTARDTHWANVGTLEKDVIAFLISPGLTGGPAWPAVTQSYQVVRTSEGTIVASNGLSDVFAEEPFENGFGSEVYIEVAETKETAFADIQNHWTTVALMEFAQNVAHAGGINEHLDQYGVASMELYVDDAPEGWKTANGTVGALIGMSAPNTAAEFANMPCSPARTICLTLIREDELAFMMGSAENRASLAQSLMDAGHGHVTSINRESVLG